MNDNQDGHRSVAAPDEPEYKAVIERYESAPDQCTIFVTGLPDVEHMSTWITASEGSFVHLGTMR